MNTAGKKNRKKKNMMEHGENLDGSGGRKK